MNNRNRIPGAGAGRHAAASQRDKIQLAAQLGWATKGALYLTLGLLAVMAAVGSGGKISGGEGVIDWVKHQPFGTVLLVLAGVGFACYALWRGLQVVFDPEHHDSDKEMIAKRIGWGLSGVMHGALAVASFQAVMGTGGGKQQRMWLSSIMQESWGPVVIGVLGAFVIGVGLYQFKKALSLSFLEEVDTRSMSPKERDAIRLVGRLGHAARGVVFPIIGFFLIKGAVNANSSQVKGVGGALHEIAQAGAVVLVIIAIGLTAYGILQLFFAKYRRVVL